MEVPLRRGSAMPVYMSDDEFDGFVSDALDQVPAELSAEMSNGDLVEPENAEDPHISGCIRGGAHRTHPRLRRLSARYHHHLP